MSALIVAPSSRVISSAFNVIVFQSAAAAIAASNVAYSVPHILASGAGSACITNVTF
jgi:hypothetical protein